MPARLMVEGGADVAVEAGQQDALAREVGGELEFFVVGAGTADQADRLLVEPVTVQGALIIAADIAVGQHHIQHVGLKLGEQVTQAA